MDTLLSPASSIDLEAVRKGTEKMEMKNPYLKQELEVIFTPELNQELRYCFDPTQLEKIKYRPVQIDSERWQCACGAVCEGDTCAECGMQKTIAFGKINARYLEKHRNDRLDRMSALIGKTKKTKNKPSRLKVVFAVAVIAVIAVCVVCLVALFGSGHKSPGETLPPVQNSDFGPTTNPPLKTSVVPGTSSDSPVSSSGPDTSFLPADTTSETETDTLDTGSTPSVPVTETSVPDTVTVPPDTTSSVPVTTSNVPETTQTPAVPTDPSQWSPSSGNLVMGGLVYSSPEYDYTGGSSLVRRGKDGTSDKVLSERPAAYICGFADALFFLSGGDLYHIDLPTGKETVLKNSVSIAAVAHDTLYYVSGSTLFRRSVDSEDVPLFSGTILMLEQAGGHLYFSTTDGLYRIADASSDAFFVGRQLAQCTSVCEFDNLIFYTVWGQLMAFRESENLPLGVLGLDGWSYTAILHCGDRVFYRAEKEGSFVWYETDTLFTFRKDIGVHTASLYPTNVGYYDGELHFVAS